MPGYHVYTKPCALSLSFSCLNKAADYLNSSRLFNILATYFLTSSLANDSRCGGP